MRNTLPKTMQQTVLVVGIGQMGLCHALAYHRNLGYRIIGLVNRSPVSLPNDLQKYPMISSFEDGLALKPDVVSINTHTDSHAEYAIAAMEAGSHVFIEKPLAAIVADAEKVVATAKRTKRKLMVGYILRHHPSWTEFIRRARTLGPPYVMRMNLNQRSNDEAWAIHKKILQTTSPVVDCGVHYIDVMLQITDSPPVQVRGMGVRLSSEIAENQVNYGHLQVLFADGSVGWYEAGWGPMISETAYFVKDIMGPRGSVSIVMSDSSGSADVNSHTKTSQIKQYNAVDRKEESVTMDGEADHQMLCESEQQALLEAIEQDIDLSRHMEDAIRSLKVVLAADVSMRENRAVDL